MEYLAIGLVLLVAIEHVYILVLEMFLWSTPKGMKTFGMSKEDAIKKVKEKEIVLTPTEKELEKKATELQKK